MPNWNDVLKEITNVRSQAKKDESGAVDRIRRSYLAKLSKYTGRNAIAYYSGF